MEYLNFENSGGIYDRLGGSAGAAAYWKALQSRRTSPNGLFGFKIFISNYKHTLAKHPELVPLIAADEVIFLRRRDKVAQALSHYRAMQSGIWFDGVKGEKRPEYDFEKILRSYRAAKVQDAEWERLFGLTNCKPIRVEYEDLLADADPEVARICDALEVVQEPAARLPFIPLTKPQADGTTHEWYARFVEDYEQRSGASPPDATRGCKPPLLEPPATASAIPA
jgi:LPS sulfotransferase NodH